MNFADGIAMFLLGFLGTGHCIGMCGPLIFAFPGSAGRFSAHLWYHGGRLLSYCLAGALMGSIGAGLVAVSGGVPSASVTLMQRIQFGLLFLTAVFMLLFGLGRFGLMREPQWMSVAEPQRIPGLKSFLQRVLVSPTGPKLLLLGGLMGFIPCGLSYAALAGSLPCGGFWSGAVLLFFFGLGTLPGLLLLGTGFSGLFRHHQKLTELLAGLVMIAMAVRLMVNALQIIL